jgi:hypothetical protein
MYGGLVELSNTVANAFVTPALHGGTFNGASSVMFLNGTQNVTGNPGAQGSTGFMMGARFNGDDRWTGHIAEVLIYNGGLSTAQRQQVEGYLSRKWGVSPTQASFSLGSPLSIPGCSLWLDSADSSTLFTDTSGTTVAQQGQTVARWNDKSSNGNYVLQTTSGNRPALSTYSTGRSSVYFATNGLSLVSVSNTVSSGNASRTAFLLQVAPNSSSIVRVGTGTHSANSPPSAFGFDNNTTVPAVVSPYVYTGADILQTATLRSPSVLYAYYDASASQLGGGYNFSNILTSSTTLNTTAGPWYLGLRPDGFGCVDSHIIEFIHFNRVITTTERRQVEAYLANKWGLTSTNSLVLPTTHPYRLAPPMLRPFTPLDISGCSLWMDAADRTTMTLSGTGVSSWRDKSPNAFAASGSNLPGYSATALDGRPGITFNGSTQYFDLGNVLNLTSNQLFAFVVCKFNSTANGAVLGKSLAGGAVGRYSLLRESGVLFPLVQTSTTVNSSGFSDSSTAVRLLNVAWNRSTLQLYENGTSRYSTALADATSFSNAYNFLIGAYQSSSGGLPPFAGFYLNGVISEVVLYLGTLTSADRQRVEAYLAQKWGFSAPPSSVSLGNPLSIPGCGLWLDAGDSSTFDLSGTSILRWRDKSGNSNTATAQGTPTLSNAINGLQSVLCGTSNAFAGSISLTLSTLTCFAVAMTTRALPNAGGDQRLVSISTPGNTDWSGANRAIVMFNQGGTSTIASYRNNAALANSTIVSNVPFLAVSQFDGTNALMWLNGAPGTRASAASGGTFASTLYGIGNQAVPTTEFWTGPVGEVIVYSGSLTTSDRQRVEAYLSGKWGIAVSSNFLPSGHIGRIAPAMSAQFLPTTLGNCALWFDAADRTTMTLSGSNVTAWADKSGNGRITSAVVGTPVLSNNSSLGKNGVFFNGSAHFTGSFPYTSNTLSWFVVATIDSDAPSSYGRILSFGDSNQYDYDSALRLTAVARYDVTNGIFVYRNAFIGSNILFTYSTPFLFSDVLNGTSNFPFLNGTSQTNYATSGNFGFSIYGLSSSGGLNATQRNKGFIFEAIVFSNALSTSERQQVEGYLARKWGLSGPVPSLSIGTPLSISGCSLWLDAADSSTYDLSGTNVLRWRDKSGNSNTATAIVGGVFPVFQSNGMFFAGSNNMGFTTPLTSSSSVESGFFVCQGTGGWGGVNTLIGSATNGGRQFRVASAQIQTINQNVANVLATGSSIPANTILLIEFVNTGSVLTHYSNASVYASGAASAYSSGMTSMIGTRGVETMTGYIYEAVMYSNALSTAQRQQVEAYLANKWGISIAPTFSLPSTHPYKMTPLL